VKPDFLKQISADLNLFQDVYYCSIDLEQEHLYFPRGVLDWFAIIARWFQTDQNERIVKLFVALFLKEKLTSERSASSPFSW